MRRATWFCVDIECSGPVPGLYDMISLGVVCVVQRDGAFELSDPLYLEFCPTAPRVDAGAMAVNGLDLDELRRNGLSLGDGLSRLSEWVAQHTEGSTTPVFVGHNAPFDWSFVNHGYVSEGLPNPFGYKALDTKALAMGVLGVHWFDANKELLEERLGLPQPDKGLVHRADYDAWYQAKILVGLLVRRPECVDL